MAAIANIFAGKLVDVLEKLVTDEVVMLLGVNDELQRLQEKLELIKAVLSDAGRNRIEDKTVDLWLAKLKDVMYDADDIIDLCRVKARILQQGESGEKPDITPSSVRTPLCRFPLFSSCCTTVTSIPFRHEIGKDIQRLNKRLEEIDKDRSTFNIHFTGGSSSQSRAVTVSQENQHPVPPSYVVGEKTEALARKLMDSLGKTEVESLIFAIVGLGGIGKTTLAQKIFSNEKLQGRFDARCWLSVPRSYSEVELLKQIIRSMGGHYGQENTTTELLPLLGPSLRGKRFFLVLDGVWTADVWEHFLGDPLKQAGKPTSRVLITTRKVDIARRMGTMNAEIHQVPKLDVKDGCALLCKCVFGDGADESIQNLHEIGMQIVQKCDGLPLAIKAIAGVLKENGSRRRSVWEDVHRSHAWSVGGELPEEVRGALYLSYEDLPSQLRQCFLFCSLFPEGSKMDRLGLIRSWIAEGFILAQGDSLLEDIAERYYNSLISRNLLHSAMSDVNSCTMHSLIRSLAVSLTRDESYSAIESVTTMVSKLRRLAIEDRKGYAVVLNAIKNPHCLRTLLAVESKLIEAQDLFQRFTRLRILDLRDSCIESIPESIQNLYHLRYLDLDGTRIHKLPESLGCLTNLQFLNLNLCKSLCTLPKAIVQLCNLRCLGLSKTPVSFVPSGIGQLRNLNVLIGFVVGDDNNNYDPRQGCQLDELQSLSQLRTLHISRLERFRTADVRPLNDKCDLKELKLEWKGVADQSFISTLAEETYESLFPPQNLESLEIISFLGNNFPTWICTLQNLTSMILHGCRSCQVLPPLGKLRELKVLEIYDSSAVTIGHEFLGLDAMDDDNEAPMAVFPKLEVLTMSEMYLLKEWIIDMKELDDGRGRTIKLFPCLRKLKLNACLKLKALPEGLRIASDLKYCKFSSNHGLREIKDIPSLEELHVINCHRLESISSLPSLEELDVRNCGRLESISNLPVLREMSLASQTVQFKSVGLNSLQKLELTLHGERFPEWLLQLLQELKANGSSQTFHWRCSWHLSDRCSEGGECWPLPSHTTDLTTIGQHR